MLDSNRKVIFDILSLSGPQFLCLTERHTEKLRIWSKMATDFGFNCGSLARSSGPPLNIYIVYIVNIYIQLHTEALMKAVCICIFYLGRNICYFNKIFNRVHQLEFSVFFEPFTYAIYMYICSKNRIKRENTNCGNKTLVYKDKNKYFGLITR